MNKLKITPTIRRNHYYQYAVSVELFVQRGDDMAQARIATDIIHCASLEDAREMEKRLSLSDGPYHRHATVCLLVHDYKQRRVYVPLSSIDE